MSPVTGCDGVATPYDRQTSLGCSALIELLQSALMGCGPPIPQPRGLQWALMVSTCAQVFWQLVQALARIDTGYTRLTTNHLLIGSMSAPLPRGNLRSPLKA